MMNFIEYPESKPEVKEGEIYAGLFLVEVPEYSPLGYWVCEYHKDFGFQSETGEIINEYVEVIF